MRPLRWPGLQCPADRIGDLIVADLPGGARPRLVIKTIQSKQDQTFPPFANRAAENPKPLRDQAIMSAFGCRQDNTRSQSQSLASRTPPRQRFQLAPLLRRQLVAREERSLNAL